MKIDLVCLKFPGLSLADVDLPHINPGVGSSCPSGACRRQQALRLRHGQTCRRFTVSIVILDIKVNLRILSSRLSWHTGAPFGKAAQRRERWSSCRHLRRWPCYTCRQSGRNFPDHFKDWEDGVEVDDHDFLQAGLSHMATDVVNSTLGVVILRKSPCFNLFPNQHFIFLLRRTATSLSCWVYHWYNQVWSKPLLPHIHRWMILPNGDGDHLYLFMFYWKVL